MIDFIFQVGVNVRFLSWMIQFIPFFVGWSLEHIVANKLLVKVITVIALVAGTLPNIYMIIKVLLQDLALVRDDGTKPPGTTTSDVMLKGAARLLMNVPRIFTILTIFKHPATSIVKWIPSLSSIVMTGAAIHYGRLVFDMATDSVYSV
jgi:hypothetical protein